MCKKYNNKINVNYPLKKDLKKAYIKYESGRSMVEMLGVLAVIGVLSIGGIVGYSYGMDKYRANETINDIMLKSIDIVANINQDKAPDASSWPTTNPIGYPLSFVQDIPNDRYGIQIQNVPSRVCKMVGDALKNLSIVYVGSEDYTPETEDDPCDLSDKNTMEFYFETLKCEPACGDDEICLWGECVSKTIEETPWRGDTTSCTQDSDCAPCGWCKSSYECHPKNNGLACSTESVTDGVCHWGECLPKSGCNDDKPCTGKYEYCASPNTSCTEAFPDGSTGTCIKADFKPLTINGTEYWISNTALSWWDADAACKALGFNGLISVYDLVPDWDGTFNKKTKLNDLGKELVLRTALSAFWAIEDSDTCSSCSIIKYWGYEAEDISIVRSDRNDEYALSIFHHAICK